jgi:predicted nucleic acid-binding protein
MTIFVVDASVAIKWFVPEVDSAVARRLLGHSDRYVAPDLLFPEMANAIWKKIQRGDLSEEDGRRIAVDIERADVETFPSRDLAAKAVDLALATGRTTYDAMYVALAIRHTTRVITADRRLFNAATAIAAIAPYVQLL